MTAEKLVGQTHASGGLGTEIDSDAEKVCRTSSFTPLAAYAVFGTRGSGNLTSFTAIPGHHFKYIGGASPYTLGAANASIVNFDRVRH